MSLPISCFSTICRSCLMYCKNENYNILQTKWENINLKEILDYFSTFVDIEMSYSATLPQNMCKNCIKSFYRSYTFIKLYQESQNKLKQSITAAKTGSNNKKELQVEIEEQLENDTKLQPEPIKLECNTFETVLVDSLSDNNDNYDNDVSSSADIDIVDTIKKEIKQTAIKSDDEKGAKRGYGSKKGPPYICPTCLASFDDYPTLKSHRIETKHRKARNFVCEYCQKRHDGHTKYLEHIRTHTGEKPNVCNTCGKGFNFKTDLKRHMALHSDAKPYNCQFCNKGFCRKQYLTDHERKHTGERLICSFCGKGFHSYSTLFYHEKTHKGPAGYIRNGDPMSKDKFFNCHMCDKVLLNEQTLKTHLLLHGPKNFSCEKCGKTFINNSRLKDHIKFAHQETSFPCSLCDKVYRQKATLLTHMKSHTGQNVYTCDVCFKQFACKGSLYQHKRIHTGDTTYQCKECSHICINRRHLENHLRVHTGEKPFRCEECGKAFTQKANLAAHIKIHTGDKKHNCNVCGKAFYDARSVRKHMNVHEKADESLSVT